MTFDALTVLALVISGVLSGTLGALVGIGGGVLLIPVLTLGFGVDLRVATATSLVAVIATSTATGSVFVGSGLANMRLGMTLEVATAIGGVTGGLVAASLPISVLVRVFAVLLIVTAVLMVRKKREDAGAAATTSDGQMHTTDTPDAPAAASQPPSQSQGSLDGTYYDDREKRLISYHPTRVAIGSAVALLAGMVSGLLGVGGGFLKVPAMTLGMRVPLRVAAATSNFMIGVTAASSLFVYFARGDLHPLLASPVAIGVAGGSLAGARIGKSASPRALSYLLAAVLTVVAVQMLVKGSR